MAYRAILDLKMSFVLRPDKERLNIPAVHKQSALPNKNKQQAPLGRTK
jgi:hypothetical protein